ncbi:MAG TPA: hypothetical protein VD789_12260 [Thermomicrobiales bacterium]|nr:hypothetical protein [Thermomicrobiales bacterium]
MSDDKEQRERHRTTIDEARQEGIGEPEEGADPSVPSYANTEPNEIIDLGVDEPVVPERLQGKPPRHLRDRPRDDS